MVFIDRDREPRDSWIERKRVTLTISGIGTGLFLIYQWLFFWRFHFIWPISLLEEYLYSWGGVLGAILIYILAKGPRAFRQEPGDTTIAITEVLLTQVNPIFLAMIVGAVMFGNMQLPPTSHFFIWVVGIMLMLIIVIEIYVGIRYAVRTID